MVILAKIILGIVFAVVAALILITLWIIGCILRHEPRVVLSIAGAGVACVVAALTVAWAINTIEDR